MSDRINKIAYLPIDHQKAFRLSMLNLEKEHDILESNYQIYCQAWKDAEREYQRALDRAEKSRDRLWWLSLIMTILTILGAIT